MPPMVWPATIATVKSATPSTPADRPWVVTNQAPARPPSTIHHAMRPARSPSRTRPMPSRPGRQNASTTSRITRPEPNEMSAAVYGSSIAAASWPFTRDCRATPAPKTTASTIATHIGMRDRSACA